MKYILLILFFAPLWGWGQTFGSPIPSSKLILYTGTEKDTVKIIYLYCDTSGKSRLLTEVLPDGMEIGYYGSPQSIYWDFGYKAFVTEWVQGGCTGVGFAYNVFFDKNKKPLPKNIVVWDYKIIQ